MAREIASSAGGDRVVKRTVTLGALSLATIVANLLFYWYVLVTFGPGMETDALFAGLLIPQLLLTILGDSLGYVLVPLFSGEDPDRARRDGWAVLLLTGVAFGLSALLLSLSAPVWVPWLVPGFSEAGKSLTVALTRIQLAGLVFLAMTGVLGSLLRARGHFVRAEALPLLANILGLLLMALTLRRGGITTAAWIMVLRSLILTLMLSSALGRYRSVQWSAPLLKETWTRLRPLLAGAFFYKTEPLLDRWLSSLASTGRLSILYLGQQAFMLVNQVINRAIVVPMIPALAVHAKLERWAAFRREYRARLRHVTLLTGGGFLVLLLVGRSLLALLIGYGPISDQNIQLLWLVMIALGGLLVAGAMGQILSSAFYAMGDTTTPTRIGMVVFCAGAVFKIVGFLTHGIPGLGIGTSLYYGLSALSLWLAIEGKMKRVSVS